MAFTIDLEYFDTECKRITGDMAYFFDCTIDERNFREDADEMQKCRLYTMFAWCNIVNMDLQPVLVHQYL